MRRLLDPYNETLREVRRLLTILFRYNQTMEFAIGIGIGVVIALIAGKRKKRNSQTDSSPDANAERLRRQKVDEELITVILPTINNDK